jgi:hypothetical protein
MSTFAAVGPLRNNLAPMVRTVTHPGISDTSYAPAVPSRSAVCSAVCSAVLTQSSFLATLQIGAVGASVAEAVNEIWDRLF